MRDEIYSTQRPGVLAETPVHDTIGFNRLLGCWMIRNDVYLADSILRYRHILVVWIVLHTGVSELMP